VKLCINCKHWLLSEASPKDLMMSRCGYERPITPVTGQLLPILDLPFASHERKATGRCTPLGEHYEESTPTLTVEETQELLQGDIRHE
jgi:hypothetical protein